MSRKSKFFAFFFLLNALTLVLSEEINYDYNEKAGQADVTKTTGVTKFSLKFSNSVPDFIKITVTPKSGYDTPSLCFSETSMDCDKDRVINAKRADKKPVIACATGSQASKKNVLYTSVACQKDECGFTIKFEGDSACKLDINDGVVFSYVATANNANMKFDLVGLSGLESFMNIGLEGSKKANITLENQPSNVQRQDFESARFIYYLIGQNNTESKTLQTITVKDAQVGEYIRITAYITNDAVGPDNLLYPGGPAVMGAVFKNDLTYPEVCLPMSSMANEFKDNSYFYLTAKVYSQYALFWPGDENKNYIDGIEIESYNGLVSFMIESQGKLRYACFEFTFREDYDKIPVLFSAQIIPAAGKKTPDFYFMNPPLQIGETYRQMLSKGKSVIYHGARIAENTRVNYNIYNRQGVAFMWVGDCTDIANCKFDMSGEDPAKDNNIEAIRNIGRNILYDRKVPKAMEVLGPEKRVMIVKCMDDGSNESGYCEFDVTIYTQTDEIKLGTTNFVKYVKKDETGKFLIDFNRATKLLSVGVQIMVHSGEVVFDGENPTGWDEMAKPEKFILANKVFLNFKLNRFAAEKLYVTYKAIKDSFFTIKYKYHLAELSTDYEDEVIQPEESYLIQIDPEPEKNLTIYIENDRYKQKEIFLTNFFALNCDFRIFTKRITGTIEVPITDGYGQDILTSKDGATYSSPLYTYTIQVDKPDPSNYNSKKCMMYVSGFTTIDLLTTPRILIGNNVNQQMILDENFRNMKFLYPVPDTSIDLVVYFNIINKASFYAEIAVNTDEQRIYSEVITHSTPVYLKGENYKSYCKEDTYCSILVIIFYAFPFQDLPATNPMVEITVREATKIDMKLRVPSYLQKGIAKKDFTTGDGYYYLYTDLGKNDQGDITVNFFRDYCEVYGRIVRKEEADPKNDIEWMDRYRLPSEEWKGDDANYNKYLKKYHVSVEDTEDCISGCYLILGIRISQIGEYVSDNKFYPFSIITNLSPSTFGEAADIPVITIQVDEFIIGNVDVSKNVKITQYYQVWLPRDTFQLQFDWQSDLAGLYVNVGDDKPTATNADFTLIPNGIDSVLYINRPQIMEVMKRKKIPHPAGEDSFEDVKFTIGIWTDKTDTADTELYSLRVHEANIANYDIEEGVDFDIIELNTDQKVLCKPTRTGETFRCLFMVIYDEEDIKQKMDLLVYARSTFRGDTTEIYASFIDSEIYDEYDFENLKKKIPSYESSDYNSVKDDKVYFHIKLNTTHSGKYLYVNCRSQFYDDILIVASMLSYNTEANPIEFYPNARTENLIQVKKDKLALGFSGKTSIIVNIENLDGEADIRWENDTNYVYHLRGKGDRLTLTTSKDLGKLIFTNLEYDPNKESPGFVFVLDFYSRDTSKNFDEVTYGNSLEISYRDTDLPIYLYSKEVDYANDINLAVTFRDSQFETEGEYDVPPIIVRAYLDKRDVIYAAKSNPEFEPPDENKMDGIYDVAIKTAWVFLSDIIMNTHFVIDPEKYPTILFYVGKNPEYKKEKVYNTFSVEAQFSRANNLVIPVEKVYNYAKYNGILTSYYKLKNEKSKKYMKISLSFNGDALSWAVGPINAHQNETDLNVKTEYSNGKYLITIEPKEKDFIYLNFFKTDYTADVILAAQNYVFKYINVEKESDYIDFKVYDNNNKLTTTEEKQNDGKVKITCKFNKIDVDYTKANITYFLKIADAKNYIKGESFNTIAATETPYYAVYKRNPESKGNEITLTATGDFANWCYIQVIAQIQQNKVLEYVAYNAIYQERGSGNKDEEPKEEEGSNTGLLIGISVSLAVLIIGLAVVVFYFQQKNKSLMNQVKHVSFQQNSANSDPDLLLSKPQETKS